MIDFPYLQGLSTSGDREKQITGYASGVFDLFHIGHLNVIERARRECDRLIVGVASDEYVLDAKGRLPVIPYEERLAIVTALRAVDVAVVDESEDKTLAWRQNRFDVIFKGDDWRGTPKGERLESAMRSVGAEVVYFPYTLHTSSRILRAHIDPGAAVADSRGSSTNEGVSNVG